MRTRRHPAADLAFAALFAATLPMLGTGGTFMQGKVKTDRTVIVAATVDAPPAEVYRRWTTEAGVRSFFAPEARIDARPGGRYEILFAPAQDPQGLSHGTTGARLLALRPNRRVVFEWITFAGDTTLGVNSPPWAPPDVRNERPLPTWVEITLDPAGAGRTRVTLKHHGFRHGERWDRSYAFFSGAWRHVVDALAASVRETAGSATAAPAGSVAPRQRQKP